MRKNIVAGNWKSNLTVNQAKSLILDINKYEDNLDCEIVVCPPFPYIGFSRRVNDGGYKVGAQNVSKFDFGAYTGEITAEMLKSFAADYCIIGHSERRKYFNESDKDLKDKAERLLRNEIQPIFCCGEVLEDRERQKHFEVVKSQIENALFEFSENQIKQIVIAYEPVWAIGTGKTASPEQAEEMHAFIRNLIKEKYSQSVADEISILYGGSVKPENAKEIFAMENVDGGLIGGASLKADAFLEIAKSF